MERCRLESLKNSDDVFLTKNSWIVSSDLVMAKFECWILKSFNQIFKFHSISVNWRMTYYRGQFLIRECLLTLKCIFYTAITGKACVRKFTNLKTTTKLSDDPYFNWSILFSINNNLNQFSLNSNTLLVGSSVLPPFLNPQTIEFIWWLGPSQLSCVIISQKPNFKQDVPLALLNDFWPFMSASFCCHKQTAFNPV